MRKIFFPAFTLAVLSLFFSLRITHSPDTKKSHAENPDEKMRPSDHFFMQRSYPDAVFDIRAFERSMKESNSMHKTSISSLNFPWQLQGPGNIGGRINAIAVHPSNNQIILVGCAAGGIFKTTNGGNSWNPVFESQAWLAIGDITFDPSSLNTVYVGTGDPNVSGYPFIGNGIYKSTNGGGTWSHLGLDSVRVISKILVHPSNSSIIYVAAIGYPMARNNHRGVYKTTDGGVTWNQIKFFSNQAGAIDLVMDASSPNTLYTTGWDRIRTNQESTIFGPASQIWKTTDGGTTWNALSNGLPAAPLSRINLAISQSDPSVLYASVIDTTLELLSVYRSSNWGISWAATAMTGIDPYCMGGFGWYFANIYVNPTNPNDIFLNGIQLWRSTDGGSNWNMNDPDWWMYDVHADKHDLAFLGGSSYLVATDGGLYKTTNNGQNWADIENIPNSQFYRVSVSPDYPGQFFGGLQDNGTTQGNLSNINAWPRLFGGDGFTVAFDPDNANNFTATVQNGDFYFTDDGGFSFYDFTTGIDPNDRKNWDSPIICNPKSGNTWYAGTDKVYKITRGIYDTWMPVSSDLTDGNIFGERFHNVSAVGIDPIDTSRVFAGTSDGNVWISTNAGTTWTDITTGLPNRYVTRVNASPNTAGQLYVTHSGYKYDEYIPHIHKSTNNGSSWTDISGDLPQMPVNDVAVFPGTDSIIAVATDAGIYLTQNWGQHWEKIGNNLPTIPVYDIEFDTTTRVLVAGTFARSLWTFPMDSLIPAVIDTTVIVSRPGMDSENPLSIYPNPAIDILNVCLSSTEGTLEIYDLSGKKWLRAEVKNNFEADVKAFSPGIYFCRLTQKNGKIISKKFLKL